MTMPAPSQVDWAIAGALAIAAWIAPGPLYVLALALFGLPHVVWEIAWIKTATAGRLPVTWWRMLIGILVLQAAGRFLAMSGWLDADAAGTIDLLTLAAAVGLIALLPTMASTGNALRLGGFGIAGSLWLGWIVWDGDIEKIVAALFVLSVAHNFTPVLLRMLRPGDGASNSWAFGALFLLPVLMLALPESSVAASVAELLPWRPAEAAWLQDATDAARPNVLSALVLAQCLHYLAVIRILPRDLGHAWSSKPWLWPALGATALLAIGFALNFPEARRVYAIAAGFHAWLEWPILLALLGSAGVEFRRPGQSIAEKK